MCGIAGWVAQAPNGPERRVMDGMLASIGHRGPDDAGCWFATTADGAYEIGLGHVRLAIIDLAGARQPMLDEERGLTLVFNGEIYNFRELREQLIALGHAFRLDSDTEVLLHAYREWGPDCVERLHGMFAFAMWDAPRQRLTLARDRFGKKPLFLFETGGGLYFASEIKALLRLPQVTPKVDTDAVWDYMAYRYVPAPRTLFAGIRKLDPGTVAVVERGRLSERAFYQPPDRRARGQDEADVGDAQAVRRFGELLDHAVSQRMVSDVPFGAFLSGGIDSSAVVGLMSRHSTLPVKTFSVGFKEGAYSELDYAGEIARLFHTEHHELIVSHRDIIDLLPQVVGFRDAPASEPADVPLYLLAREARRSVKMVLTGEGADEVLAGYPKHVFEPYAPLYQKIPGPLRSGLFEPLARALPYKHQRIKTAVCTMGIADTGERHARWFGALSPRERTGLLRLPAPGVPAPDASRHSEPGNSLLRGILYFDQTSWLPDNLLERGDRMTMAASLEARMPFMDHRLADYVSTLPDRFRVRGKRTKWLLYEAMSQIIPRRILERPKAGFSMPINEWLRGELRDYLLAHLDSPNSHIADYFHRDALKRVIGEHLGGRQNHEKLLWAMLNLEIWHRRYLTGPA